MEVIEKLVKLFEIEFEIYTRDLIILTGVRRQLIREPLASNFKLIEGN